MPEVNTKIPDVFILCGGQGTRFRAVREDIPKALAPINGVPFLDLLLDNLISQGCKRIILGTGYLGEQLESHVRHRNDADYLISREMQPLGTGGAIRHAMPLIHSEQIMVLNGDSYIVFSVKNLLDFHITQQAEATILLSTKTAGTDYGNVEIDENYKVLFFQEKPKDASTQLINAGVYCIERNLIQQYPEEYASLENEWFPQWLGNEHILGMLVAERFYDIGTLERFELAQHKLYNLRPS